MPDEQNGDDRRKQHADEVLTEAVTMLGAVRYPVERLLMDGDPSRQIAVTARSRDTDLVVLGARGLRRLGRLLLGSVSETVLHHVTVPS